MCPVQSVYYGPVLTHTRVNAYLSLNNRNRIPFCRAYPVSNVTSVNSAAEANADTSPPITRALVSSRKKPIWVMRASSKQVIKIESSQI